MGKKRFPKRTLSYHWTWTWKDVRSVSSVSESVSTRGETVIEEPAHRGQQSTGLIRQQHCSGCVCQFTWADVFLCAWAREVGIIKNGFDKMVCDFLNFFLFISFVGSLSWKLWSFGCKYLKRNHKNSFWGMTFFFCIEIHL